VIALTCYDEVLQLNKDRLRPQSPYTADLVDACLKVLQGSSRNDSYLYIKSSESDENRKGPYSALLTV
jgi:hypothetical protein